MTRVNGVAALSQDWDEAYRSGEYREQWDYSHVSQEVATCAALGVFPRDGVILDAGCGSGSDAVFLAALGFSVKALDISPLALELVKEKAARTGAKVETFQGSATKMPFDDRSIDFALDRGLFHNLSDDDGRAYGTELARILKPGAGILLRGARISYGGSFNPVTKERLSSAFPEELFSSGPVVPMTMVSDATEDPNLDGAVVMIHRR